MIGWRNQKCGVCSKSGGENDIRAGGLQTPGVSNEKWTNSKWKNIRQPIGMGHFIKSATQQRKNRPRNKLGLFDMSSSFFCVWARSSGFVFAWWLFSS